MSWVNFAWPMMIGMSVVIGAIHLTIWARRRHDVAHLYFFVLTASVAAITLSELLQLRAHDPRDFSEIWRWTHVPIFTGIVAIVLFLRAYFRAGNTWLAAAVIGVRVVSLIINFLAPVNINYRSLDEVRQVPIIGGDVISIGYGQPNPARHVAELSLLLLVAFIASVWLEVRRRNDVVQRRRATRICASLAILVFGSTVNAMLIHSGIVHMPYFVGVLFLTVVAAIGFELGSDVARAAELAGQLQVSERRMDLAATAAGMALWEWDVRRDAVWLSDRGRELLGYRPGMPLDQRAFLDRIEPGARVAVQRAVEEATLQRAAFEGEYPAVLPDGRRRWFSARGRVENGGRDGDLLMRGVTLDITARKEVEQRFHAVFESTPCAILLVDPEGRVILANPQAARTFRLDQGRLTGAALHELVPEGLPEPHALGAPWGDAAEPASAVMHERMGRRGDGTVVPLEVRVSRLEEEGEAFVLAMLVDVTETRLARQQVAQQRDELAHLSRVAMLGELSGALAHELNQPLAAILSNAQAAERLMARPEPELDVVREILADIVRSDKRAGEVIVRLRALLRKEEPRHEVLDLNELVGEVLSLMRSDLLGRHVTVVTELDPHVPSVVGDRVQLQQVLLNLVMNGCDAIGSAGADRGLTVRTAADDGGALWAVIDRGIGIPDADLARIFQPFVTSKPAGLGLGLAVCRTIVESHRGRVWAANNPGGGATVHVWLPAAEGP